MARTTENRRSIAETIALAFGVVYTLVGLVGFTATSGIAFAEREGDLLLGVFEVNPLHNVVHLAVGIALLWGGLAGAAAARAVAATVGTTYLLVGIAGLFMLDSDANVLALNAADNMLHLLSAVVLLGAAILGGPRVIAIEDRAGTTRSRNRADSR